MLHVNATSNHTCPANIQHESLHPTIAKDISEIATKLAILVLPANVCGSHGGPRLPDTIERVECGQHGQSDGVHAWEIIASGRLQRLKR
ncbi:hypothetical protein HDF17_000682 [Granulicella arctica]|uniref:Uncharacterized protein n=1 Tax=Granulicella arctica TaxID=940613 RepID=A0A7Y9PEF9_9BACT|nr:hypothetical protein [Granulicella arctica]